MKKWLDVKKEIESPEKPITTTNINRKINSGNRFARALNSDRK